MEVAHILPFTPADTYVSLFAIHQETRQWKELQMQNVQFQICFGKRGKCFFFVCFCNTTNVYPTAEEMV